LRIFSSMPSSDPILLHCPFTVNLLYSLPTFTFKVVDGVCGKEQR
jgi:hypothetical protein